MNFNQLNIFEKLYKQEVSELQVTYLAKVSQR